jgi:hypothetical protein
MSRNNNNYQDIPSSAKDLLRTQQKDIVCTDCGGISASKVQQLLSTLEGTTQLFNSNSTKSKKKNSPRNNSQKTSRRRNMKKTKRKLNIKKKRTTLSSRNNNKIRSKSKINKNKLSSKRK